MSYTLLIVDDDSAWCTKLKSKLEQIDILDVLHPAQDGRIAIEALETHRPDILILDLLLPIYDGVFLINYIRREMKSYNPFIYILSAIGTDQVSKIINNLQVGYYSVKPMEVEAVADNIQSIVENCLDMETAHNAAAEQPNHLIINIGKQVDDYLFQLGLPLYKSSSVSLRCALRICLMDDSVLSKSMDLYRAISELPEMNHKNAASIESNIRAAIKSIHQKSSSYYLSCFPDKGIRPLKNTEFLHRSVYIIRSRIEVFLGD